MNQEKIGKFILELRKEKNMTQQELADKIGVTDRAISKWENGRGMPDLSLLRPLCKELGITINELISGEKINSKNYQDKLEENIFNTIDYTNKKINKIFKIIITTIIVSIISLVIMFFIDVSRMNQNKPVVFSTWGYQYVPAIDLHEDEIYLAIKEYLVNKGDNETKHHEGEKTFVSMRVYLIEEKEKDKNYNIYSWVLEEKYYLDNNEIKQDSGSSIPYKFVVKKINDKYVVIDWKIPRDGSYYAEDMKNIFPRSVRSDMNNVHIDGTVERLGIEVEEQAKLYFHK